jgi:hypothetical protein
LVACAALPALIFVTDDARAYCPATTCNVFDPTEACELDRNGCERTGVPLSWSGQCASFAVFERGSQRSGIGYQSLVNAVIAGFNQWMNAPCPGGPPSMELFFSGPVSCEEIGFEFDAPNANVWIFRDSDWPYDLEGHQLALTTVSFDPDTGEILDADVEINSRDARLTLGDDDVEGDLLSIVTHEAGHFLGLGHTLVDGATMTGGYVLGETEFRSIAADDVEGMCAMYPPGRAAACVTEPHNGFSPECEEPRQESGCCSTAPGGSGAAGHAAPALVLLVLVAARRARPRSGRRIQRAAIWIQSK